MEQKELDRIVNPSYTTGKGCLAMLMSTGDPDATALAKYIDMSELRSDGQAEESETEKRSSGAIL